MAIRLREIYRSSNGDLWFLARDDQSGAVFVRHSANRPSGGQQTDIEIGAFLSGSTASPEQVALLQMIGSLLENSH